MAKRIRIAERPNTAIVKLIQAVQEAAKEGYEFNYSSNPYIVSSPSMIDLEINMHKVPVEEESKADVVEEVIQKPAKLEGTGEGMNPEPLKDVLQVQEEVVEEPEDPFESIPEENQPGDIKAELEAIEKHKDMKNFAKKHGLVVKSNLRNPKALKKDLLKQLEGEGE